MSSQQNMFVKQALQAWDSNVKKMSDTFAGMSDEQMMQEIAPGRNRAIYLLGHMTAVHDRMLPLLGLGDRKYQQLDEAFLVNPDKQVAELPAVSDLRAAWTDTNDTLSAQLNTLSADQLLDKHTAVSDEDFAKEPHRNRLSVLNSRTTHVAFHQGQLALIKK